MDLDVLGVCLLRDIVAQSSGLADSMLALQGLGYGPIALAGSSAQREQYAPGVRRGTSIAGFALTEPNAGSDVASLETVAEDVQDGFLLRGTKKLISNAGIAAHYVVFARTSREGGHRGISALIVHAEEVSRVERYDLIAPHPIGELHFEDVFIPRDRLVGELGGGFKLALRTLDHFRTTVGAAANGMAARALDEALARSESRYQFGTAIGRHQLIAAQLADAHVELEASRLLVMRAATSFRRGHPLAGLHSSAAKLYATEAAQRIIDRAVQIFGGDGVRRGHVVERLYREVRALRIYEGTSEIQRLVISRSLSKARHGA
ncbi:MAG: acyl-CoA dehydrogenase [Myxococcales bacterium]|nr:acyl-CoA dehydrogenase [Myxococcales bacterium]